VMGMDWDFDLIVVGGGGAGLSAAIMAKRAGANVMVLEADKQLGGATLIAGGVFYAAGTSVQRACGIEDSADAMFEHLMNLTQWELRPGLIRLICDLSGPTLEWLISLGVNFPAALLTKGGPETIYRSHPSHGLGEQIGQVLVNIAGAESVEYAVNTRISSLLVEEGRVCGVRASGMELRAPHVLISTGGFGNNVEMLQRLWPKALRHGERLIAVHDSLPFILGDGITMAEEVGAKVVGHGNGLLMPKTNHLARKVLEGVFLPPWIALVNKEGRRFIDETQPYMISGFYLNQQTDEVGYAIYDEHAVREATQDKSWTDPYGSGVAVPAWEEDTLRKKIADGDIIQADTLAELAHKVGIDAGALEVTLSKYNADCAQGVDTDFLKNTHMRFPVSTPPFYASEIRACVIGNTNAGLNIDQQCRVLDGADNPIPGLYAAGEVLGCVQGRLYNAGGLGIGNAIILGRHAGQLIGEQIRQASTAVPA
jgi:fumarate reductase flavoprotein subunit